MKKVEAHSAPRLAKSSGLVRTALQALLCLVSHTHHRIDSAIQSPSVRGSSVQQNNVLPFGVRRRYIAPRPTEHERLVATPFVLVYPARTTIESNTRCLPVIRVLCPDDEKCKWQRMYIPMSRATFESYRLLAFSTNTVKCPTRRHNRRLRGFPRYIDGLAESFYVDNSHSYFSENEGVPYRFDVPPPLWWFDTNSAVVRDTLNSTVFAVSYGCRNYCSGFTSDLYAPVVTNSGTVSYGPDVRHLIVANAFDAFRGNFEATDIVMHEFAHALNNDRQDAGSEAIKRRFDADIDALLELVRPEMSTTLDLTGFPAYFEALVDTFLAQYDPMPPIADTLPIEDANLFSARAFPQLPGTHLPLSTNEIEWHKNMFFSPSQASCSGTLNENCYRQQAMLYLIRLVIRLRDAMNAEWLNFDNNNPESVRRFVRQEAFSYMLGSGSVLPTLEYAFAPLLSDAGMAWARGETAHLPQLINRANPYLNTTKGKEELGELFRQFWPFVARMNQR